MSNDAKAIHGKAIESAQMIRDKRWQLEALGAIATAKTTFADALRIAHGMKWETEQAEMLTVVSKEMIRVGWAEVQVGEFSAALEIAQGIKWERERARIRRDTATAQARAGFGEHAVRTVGVIATIPKEHLLKITAAPVEAGDKEHFKQLLIPCAYHLAAAYTMCGLLARLYPEQAAAVVEIVKE